MPIRDEATPARRGRPAKISVNDVLDAVDSLGVENVTVASVARRLGVGHPALYRYFETRDEMVYEALHRRWLAVAWPQPAEHPDWRAYLMATAWTTWDTVEAEPDLAYSVLSATFPYSPVRFRFSELASALIGYGLQARSAAFALNAVYDLLSNTFFRERYLDLHTSDAEQALSRRHAFLPPASPALSAEAVAVFAAVESESARQWFERRLAVALDAIAAQQVEQTERQATQQTGRGA